MMTPATRSTPTAPRAMSENRLDVSAASWRVAQLHGDEQRIKPAKPVRRGDHVQGDDASHQPAGFGGGHVTRRREGQRSQDRARHADDPPDVTVVWLKRLIRSDAHQGKAKDREQGAGRVGRSESDAPRLGRQDAQIAQAAQFGAACAKKQKAARHAKRPQSRR